MDDTEREARLLVLGQIAIVRDRLFVLEEALTAYPMGDMAMNNETQDAISNLSLQTGALMGTVGRYVSAARKAGEAVH